MVDLTINGTKVAFSGSGYHDKVSTPFRLTPHLLTSLTHSELGAGTHSGRHQGLVLGPRPSRAAQRRLVRRRAQRRHGAVEQLRRTGRQGARCVVLRRVRAAYW